MTEVADLTIDDLPAGRSEASVWQVREDEIDAFAALSGDVNPLHMDAGYARLNGFEERVAHGYLLGAKVSGFIGTRLPGRRCLLLEASMDYPNPVYAGDEVTIEGEVAEVWPDRGLVRIRIRAHAKRPVGRGWVLCRVLS
jgi:3-hydroxybutyryl-CoA dehydratase